MSKSIHQIIDKGYHCILVDDGSQEVITLPFHSDQVHLIRHASNQGQGTSLQAGMHLAETLGADYVIHFDGDGQHRVQDIPRMLAPLLADKYDISFGSRFKNEVFAVSVPLTKKVLLQLARIVNYLFTGLWMTDAHNGFRVLNKKAYTSIRLKEKRMAHASEILWEVKHHNLRWCEIPVKVIYEDKKALPFFKELNRAIYILWRLIYRKCFRP